MEKEIIYLFEDENGVNKENSSFLVSIGSIVNYLQSNYIVLQNEIDGDTIYVLCQKI